jgi:hypothetical protein
MAYFEWVHLHRSLNAPLLPCHSARPLVVIGMHSQMSKHHSLSVLGDGVQSALDAAVSQSDVPSHVRTSSGVDPFSAWANGFPGVATLQRAQDALSGSECSAQAVGQTQPSLPSTSRHEGAAVRASGILQSRLIDDGSLNGPVYDPPAVACRRCAADSVPRAHAARSVPRAQAARRALWSPSDSPSNQFVSASDLLSASALRGMLTPQEPGTVVCGPDVPASFRRPRGYEGSP